MMIQVSQTTSKAATSNSAARVEDAISGRFTWVPPVVVFR